MFKNYQINISFCFSFLIEFRSIHKEIGFDCEFLEKRRFLGWRNLLDHLFMLCSGFSPVNPADLSLLLISGSFWSS